MNEQPHDIQKRIILAMLTQLLGNRARAEAWISTPRPEFKGRTATGAIDDGEYDKVLNTVGRMDKE